MTPDAKKVAVDYLLSRTEVTALVGQRIGTKTPPSTDLPWVRIHLINDGTHSTSQALHLTHVLLQFDCYSGTPREGSQWEAGTLARTIRTVLADMTGSVTGGVVSTVTFGGMHDAPDTSLDPARERTILEATLHLHP